MFGYFINYVPNYVLKTHAQYNWYAKIRGFL